MSATLSDHLRHQASTNANRPVLHFREQTITYGELDERANRIAGGLAALGVNRGDRVAHLDANHPVYFDLLFGAARNGGTLASLNWRLAPPELAYVINHCRAPVLVVGEQFVPAIEKIEGDLAHLQQVIVVGHDAERRTWDDWVDGLADHQPAEVGGPDTAVVQYYTSGTTGRPKGAMLSNRNLLTLGASFAPAVRATEQSVMQAAMPLFHISGSAVVLFGIYAGCSSVLLPTADPAEVLATIERFGVTHSVMVPALIQFLLATPETSRTDLSSLECIIYGGSPISADVLSSAIQTFGCDFLQAYGLTESTGGVVILPPQDHHTSGKLAHRLRAAGKPFPGHEMKVVDRVTLTELGTDEVGEVWLRGDMVMLGYADDPDATSASITEDGWLRTGDAGSIDSDGYLYIRDRVKDMIISGGENVYPAEIENVLMAHPEVGDAAVIGVPDARWGETVKAVVVLASSGLRDATIQDRLIAHCREHLAHYKCPTSVDVVDELPRNPTGKVLKYQLRAPHWRGHDRAVN